MPERQRLQPTPRRDSAPTLAEYESALTIDQHSLHSDCRNQPELFYHIAKAVAQARGEVEVELAIRQDAESAEVRMTEGRCAAMVATSERVRAAAIALAGRNAYLESLIALKEAYVQRKDMLKELVSLHISNYYADPVRGSESRLRDAAVEGVRASRRRDQEINRR
jgi:hypothetical protein